LYLIANEINYGNCDQQAKHGGSGVSLAFPSPLVCSHHSSLFYATTIDAAMPTIVGMAPKNQDAIDAAIVGMLADPKEIMNLCNLRDDAKKKVYAIIDKFAERGLRSLAVSRQDSPGAPWQFVSLLSLFDPPRHDSTETIRRALNLGVNVKMITGDQLAIAKETGRRLGMGTNMYPSASLLGQDKDASITALPVEELIEKADRFTGVFP
ncbi:hypothetical protein S83_051315, partial [Arachis hypogaea]